MSIFSLGKTYHSERFCDTVTDEDSMDALKKFRNKYWGNINAEIWNINDKSALENIGVIIGSYRAIKINSHDSIDFIVYRLEDCSYTLFVLPSELEEIVDKFKQNNQSKSKKRVTVQDTIRGIRSNHIFNN
jgi:hypothetical protein